MRESGCVCQRMLSSELKWKQVQDSVPVRKTKCAPPCVRACVSQSPPPGPPSCSSGGLDQAAVPPALNSAHTVVKKRKKKKEEKTETSSAHYSRGFVASRAPSQQGSVSRAQQRSLEGNRPALARTITHTHTPPIPLSQRQWNTPIRD